MVSWLSGNVLVLIGAFFEWQVLEISLDGWHTVTVYKYVFHPGQLIRPSVGRHNEYQ